MNSSPTVNFFALGAPAEGAELLSANLTAPKLWFSGGGAASGPQLPGKAQLASLPLAIRYTGGFFHTGPDQYFAGLARKKDRFSVDIAPVPARKVRGPPTSPTPSAGSTSVKAKVH